MNNTNEEITQKEEAYEGIEKPVNHMNGSKRQRRTSIPPRPRISLNLWGVLKNCIGKELSRIPLPVGSFAA